MATQVVSCSYSPTGGIAGKKFFKASKTLYTSTNADDTGIAIEETAKVGTTPLYDTAELMRAGYLDRINVYVQLAADKRGVYRMFCDPEKRASLLAKLNGSSAGTLNGKQVIGASSGVRRATYKL